MIKKFGIFVENLDFLEHAKNAFQFLESYSFHIVEEDISYLKYKGKLGNIEIFHGRSSYEIGVEFSAKGENVNAKYSLALLINLHGEEAMRDYTNPAATTVETVEKFVYMQADLTKKYARRILEGDQSIWLDLEKIGRENAEKLAIDSMISYARNFKSQTFHDKHYEDYINAFAPIEAYLTPSEKLKLNYARKHIQSV